MEFKPGDLVRITDTSGWDPDWQFATEVTWRIVAARHGFQLEPVIPRRLPYGSRVLTLSDSERTRSRIVSV